ncbi:hypothetical protein DPMN_069205 [Dreissena polymorpha]|uniref:Uncharacterized protein n=1 Tax=Dreissena polymorpha TaxID=45954 RepID=A0A9D4BMV5_DREPO|nr:hypothetical protein DPMN_069205 [Dreissena polymorpha]
MADNNANVAINATSRNRWAEQEETVIANEIIQNYDVLFGPMTGCGSLKIGEVRRRGWEAVANVLNWFVLLVLAIFQILEILAEGIFVQLIHYFVFNY